jgi:FkbM family methyltransferase
MKEIIYKIVDFFTFGKGLKKVYYGYPVRLPTRYINYFPLNYESDNFNFLQQQCKPGDIVLDIGAHIGLFSCIAAKIIGSGGQIFAFEPTPTTNILLKKTIVINELQPLVHVRDEAMGSATGSTTFYISEGSADNSNSMVSYLNDRALHGINIMVLTIDRFVQQEQLPKVNFIKIDVEGAEYDVLLGAGNTLKNLQPSCILAIHPEPIAAKGDKLEDIYDFIDRLNYDITYRGKPISKETFCANKGLIDLHLLPK